MKALLPLLLVSLLASVQPARAQLPDGIAAAAQASGLPSDAIGLWAAPAGTTSPIIAHNANAPLNPASVMKLLTTHAALEQFGSSHAWQTRAYLLGPLNGGVLEGDLAILASGDPFLTWDRLGEWLRDWRSRGLREIRGNIVVDRRLIPPPVNQAFDNAPHRAYHAEPDAFLVNFGATSLRLTPGTVGQAAAVTPLTPATPLRIANRIRTTTGACGNWRSALRADIQAEGRGLLLTLNGTLATDCGERVMHLKAGEDLNWAASVIRAQWAELGGSWQGRLVEGEQADWVTPFSSWDSPPLGEILRDMNKWSNNVVARQIFLSLGNDGTAPLSTAKSIARLQAWMPTQGLDPKQWVLENGSGLSRNERSTAAQLGALLQAAWRSPRMPEFLAAQPVLGRDGTLRNRLPDTPLAGRGYIKTGSLDGVRSAAGYLLDANGQWQAFALMINHPRATYSDRVLEATLHQLYQGQAAQAQARVR